MKKPLVFLLKFGVPAEAAVALSILKVIVVDILGGLLEAGNFLFSPRSRSIMKERSIT